MTKSPSYLHKIGKDLFAELAPLYPNPVDLKLLETIAQGYSMYVRASHEINTQGLTVPTERDSTKPHPALTALKQGHAMVLTGCNQLLKSQQPKDDGNAVKEFLAKFK